MLQKMFQTLEPFHEAIEWQRLIEQNFEDCVTTILESL